MKMKNASVKEYIKVLDSLHKEIQVQINAETYERVPELFQKCQDHAILLGTMIEGRVGEGTAAVGCLEDYCECIYQIHEALEQKGSMKAEICDSLRAQLDVFLNCAERELDIPMEVVFLPFRADYWGALESVWHAFRQDPDCDVYVVPVPYYEKYPDGTFGTMYDETDDFPPDVIVTPYQEYDFEKRRPDIIFMQNAYDACNYTFSVNPFFYSDHLKQFTNKLVYIPWFIVEEIAEGDERGIQTAKHFVTIPGVMRADQVIVQSEQMRQLYIRMLTEVEGGDTREKWEQKILGAGSPLYDQGRRRINYYQKEKMIPDEWRGLICLPDGGRKKVVLYGTSLSLLLQYKEKVIQKIETVLDIFYENKDEVTVLWRPDAVMSGEMSEVAGSELARAYCALVEQYQAQGWGIFDETADLDQLVAVADAYYGDSCRMVQMCRQAGIPVMIQDIDLC